MNRFKTTSWDTSFVIKCSAALAVLVLSLYHVFFMFDFGYIHGDEGLSLARGLRIAQGQVPIKDFDDMITPLSYLPIAAAFKVFGPSFVVARYLVFTYALFLIVVIERILNLLNVSFFLRITIIAFLVPYGVFSWPIASHHWLIAIEQLTAIYLLLHISLKVDRVKTRAFLAGVLTMSGVFTMQDQGGYFLLGLLFFYFPLMERDVLKPIFFSWLSGCSVLTLSVLIWLIPDVSVYDLYTSWVMLPLTKYSAIPGNESSLSAVGWNAQVLQSLFGQISTNPIFGLSQLFFYILFPLIILLNFFGLILLFIRSSIKREIVVLMMVGFLTFLGGYLHRISETYLLWAIPMWMTIFFWIIHELNKGSNRLTGNICTVVVSMVLVASILLPIGFRANLAKNGIVPVEGPSGTLKVPANSTQSSMQIVLDIVEKHIPLDGYLFCTGYNPIINFWSQRKNPSSYDQFIYPTLNDQHDVESVIQSLEKNGGTYVLYFSENFLLEYGNPLYTYLTQNAKVEWKMSWAKLYSL